MVRLDRLVPSQEEILARLAALERKVDHLPSPAVGARDKSSDRDGGPGSDASTPEPEAFAAPPDQCLLLIGEGSLANATQLALDAAGASLVRLCDPDDEELRQALDGEIDCTVIVSKDDHVSLRLALVIENVCPGMPVIATVQGRIVAEQLERVVENAQALSRADIVAPALAAACFQKTCCWSGAPTRAFAG